MKCSASSPPERSLSEKWNSVRITSRLTSKANLAWGSRRAPKGNSLAPARTKPALSHCRHRTRERGEVPVRIRLPYASSDPATIRPNEFPADAYERVAGHIRRHCFVPAPATTVGAHAPIECRSRRTPRGEPAMGQAQQKRRAVLIVEDDAELRSLTAALFEDEKVDTIECESVEAALAIMLMTDSASGARVVRPATPTETKRRPRPSASNQNRLPEQIGP
jgi:hypothetical protein